MSSAHAAAEGPDLSGGIPLDSLAEGKPFLGQMNGEGVVLVRRGEVVLAIGATCTHYGGPLAEGLVVGDTLRCPWHHACFSLRTGEPLKAPALNPVASWQTEVREGNVFVGEKREADPLANHGRSVAGPESVVIIGAGAAGSAAAEMLRREGYSGPITLVDPDSPAPYDRPNLSKDYLAGNAPEEWIPLRPDGFYAEHGIERREGKAESIDLAGRTVRVSGGETLSFGALLLATGSAPIRLKIPGADLKHVHTLRSLADSRALIAAAGQAREVVILGASFIGMEAAASLRHRGVAVTIVAPEAVPFEKILGAELGKALQSAHEAEGTRFRLGHTATAINDQKVTLDDGSELPAQLVLMGVGVRPELALAQTAGLKVDDGVIVDEFLRTSAPNVFAAGDIAKYPDVRTGERIRIEHWVVAQRQGQAAARNILGRQIPYRDPPFFWTRQWDLGINYVGAAKSWDEVRLDGDLEARNASIEYRKDGEVLAHAAVGRDFESLQAEAEMEKNTSGSTPLGG